MRGEHDDASGEKPHGPGSSPHARGAPYGQAHGLVCGRIIPACAGSTYRRALVGRAARDHPRIRGEHATQPYCRSAPGDHPRMRGEHKQVTGAWARLGGSSPHALGAHILCNLVEPIVGIIPACAGSTPRSRAGRNGGGDHPRMRGEHASPAFLAAPPAGSSPHARGALCERGRQVLVAGIIPACAGSTAGAGGNRGRVRDHPRMRGEHLIEGLGDAAEWGSSPHAREAPGELVDVLVRGGIIPACAGSTRSGR